MDIQKSEFAVFAENLTKTVGWPKSKVLIDNLNIQIKKGEVFGLLGPNGAGKTTTFKLLLGLVRISSGQAFIFGQQVPTAASREGVGFLPEVVNHPEYLTAREYLRYHAKLLNLSNFENAINTVMEETEVLQFADKPLGICSKGMKQRVDLARVLLGSAKLILLDEPVTGLDPLGQKLLKEVLLRLKARGISIIINSHAVGMLTEICETIGIMKGGKLILTGRIQDLLSANENRLVFRITSTNQIEEVQKSLINCISKRAISENEFEWILPAGVKISEEIARLSNCGVEILEFSPKRRTLEEVFAQAVGSAHGGNT